MITTDYLAGFIDGEGYIGIIKKRNAKSILGYNYKPVVKIAQKLSNKSILEIIQKRYGGYLSKTRQHINTNASVMWEISNQVQVKNFLKDFVGKLYLKNENLMLVLEFIELPNVKNRKDSEYQKIREDIDTKRTLIYERIRTINKRGLAETK